MKKDTKTTRQKRGSKPPVRNTVPRDGTVSGSSGLSMLDDARMKYVATLPMGRPMLPGLVSTTGRNFDARGLSRPTAILQDIELNYYGMFVSPRDYPWLQRAASRIMAQLRAEVRSNTNYSETDIILYLIQAMSVYTHGVMIKRMLQTSTFYDVRSPNVARFLNSAYTDLTGIGDITKTPRVSRTLFEDISDNVGSVHPAWLRADVLGDSWLASTKLEGALAMYCLPSDLKAVIDYYIGQIHIKELDSQYYATRIIPDSSGFLEFDITSSKYVWVDGKQYSPAKDGGSRSVPQYWEAAAQNFFVGAPLRMATMAADIRRLTNWEPCFIDMPPELGGAPTINADTKYFLTMNNAYSLEAHRIEESYNYSGADESYADGAFNKEVRINMLDYSFSDPTSVGVALLLCDVQSTRLERAHTVWSVKSESSYSEYEDVNSATQTAHTQLSSLGCALVPANDGNLVAPTIFAATTVEPLGWESVAALQSDTLCPRVSLIFRSPTSNSSFPPQRYVMENGADLSNGTRVSFTNVIDVVETFYETLLVK